MCIAKQKEIKQEKIKINTARGKFDLYPNTLLYAIVDGKRKIVSAESIPYLINTGKDIKLIFEKRFKNIKYSDVIRELLDNNSDFRQCFEKLFEINDETITPRLSIFLKKYKNSIDIKELQRKTKVEKSTIRSWFNGKVISPRNRKEFLKYLQSKFGKNHEFTKWFSNTVFPINKSIYDKVVSFFRFIGFQISKKQEIKFDMVYQDIYCIKMINHIIPNEWKKTLREILEEKINIKVDTRISDDSSIRTICTNKVPKFGFIKIYKPNNLESLVEDIKLFIKIFKELVVEDLEQHIENYKEVNSIPFFNLFLRCDEKIENITELPRSKIKELLKLEYIDKDYKSIVDTVSRVIKNNKNLENFIHALCRYYLTGIKNKKLYEIVYNNLLLEDRLFHLYNFLKIYNVFSEKYNEWLKNISNIPENIGEEKVQKIKNMRINVFYEEIVKKTVKNIITIEFPLDITIYFDNEKIRFTEFFCIGPEIDCTTSEIKNKKKKHNNKKIIKNKKMINIYRNLTMFYKSYIHLGNVFRLPFVFANVYVILKSVAIFGGDLKKYRQIKNEFIEEYEQKLDKKFFENIINELKEILKKELENTYLKKLKEKEREEIINQILEVFNIVCNIIDKKIFIIS